METIQSLRSRIDVAEDLHSVVRTMKGLAAVSIRQYERAVESLTDYSRTVELGFQVLLRQLSFVALQPEAEAEGRIAAIVFGSDQGLCGPFNRQIASHALRHFEDMSAERERLLFATVGERVRTELEAADWPVADSFMLPGAVTGIQTTVEDILVGVEMWRAEQGVNQIMLFHHRPAAGASYEPRTVRLFPVDVKWISSLREIPWPTRMLPAFSMDWNALFASLVEQHLRVVLFRALAESLASENASRLASMQAAEKNIEERIGRLRTRFHQFRQASITEELLDVVSGYEALSTE